MLCVAAAAVIDVVMQQLNNAQWAVLLVISYLVATELLSIIENLSDAGCKNLTGLITLVKKKTNMTPQAAANELKAMLDAMDPRFLTWDREQRKVEALSMAIVLLKKEDEYVKRNSIST